MKTLRIIISTIILLFFLNHQLIGNVNDSIKIAKVEYEFGWNKSICNLKIIVQCSFDCKLGTESTKKKSPSNGHIYYERLKEVFYDSITSKAKIYVPIPEYITTIINMISSDSLRLIAKKNYERESCIQTYNTTENTNMEVINGKCKTHFKIEFSYPLLIDDTKTKISISLPVIEFCFKGQMVETEPALIELN